MAAVFLPVRPPTRLTGHMALEPQLRGRPPWKSPRVWLVVAANAAVAWLVLFATCQPSHRVADRTPIRTDLIREASGLAPSRRTADLLWSHNDSRGQPIIYAVGTDGRLRGSIRLSGVINHDWEDLASFTLGGVAYLLVADVGNNNAARKHCILHVVAEPPADALSPEKELAAAPSWTINYRFEDGVHDCEAVAVDPRRGQIHLLTKRSKPPLLYSLPLRPKSSRSATDIVVAKLEGPIGAPPQPTRWQRLFPVPRGRYRGQPTGLAMSTDGRTAAVLTYGDVLLYRREENQSWVEALTNRPEVLEPHGLSQAEAICFSSDDSHLFVTGEQGNPPLVRYDASSPGARR